MPVKFSSGETPQMPSLAITGTIGSGKSLLLHKLGTLLGAKTFSADEENRRLLDHDPEVKKLILSHFGEISYLTDGTANRKALFELICHDPGARQVLESILHPRLEAVWKPLAEIFHENSDFYFLAEIPLLYEKKLEVCFDKTIVVGCSDSVRRKRLQGLRSLSMTESDAWLKLQVPQDIKVTRAHYLLWNDGTESQFLVQTQLLASHFLNV